MKITVIGGTGFIGRHLCRRLIEENHEVISVSRRKPNSSTKLQDTTCITYEYGDITSLEFVTEVSRNTEYLINLASTVVPSTSNRDPVYDVNTNLIGALNTLNASVINGISKYIYLSSGGTVYGPKNQTEPHKEEDPTNPICSYGIVKLSIEKYIHLFNVLHGLPYSIIRLSNPYGPDYALEKPQGVIHHFASMIAKNQPIHIWGDGSIERDFIFIDDAITAITKAMHHNSDQILLNVGSGKSTSINKILKIIEQVSGKTGRVSYEPSRIYDVHKSVLNIDQAKIQLGWEPSISIDEGIKLTYLDTLLSIES